MEKILKEQLGRIIRYSYPGFFALLIFALIDDKHFKQVMDTLGITLTAVSAIVVGAPLYVFYRLVIGELLLFPGVNSLHTLLADWGLVPIGVTGWLKKFNVRLGLRRAAYTYLRTQHHDQSQFGYVNFVHTELHILYITSIMTLSVCSYMTHPVKGVMAAVLVMLAAVSADIHAHARERVYFETAIGSDKIREILQKGGFVSG